MSPPTNQCPVFYRPDALPVAQPTVSKYWREKHWREKLSQDYYYPKCYSSGSAKLLSHFLFCFPQISDVLFLYKFWENYPDIISIWLPDQYKVCLCTAFRTIYWLLRSPQKGIWRLHCPMQLYHLLTLCY